MGRIDQRLDHSVETVYAKLVNPAYLEARAKASGERNIQLDVAEAGDGHAIEMSRDVESEIPSFAKKFFNPVNRIEETTTWRADGDAKRARYRIVVGSRVTLTGTLALEPRGDGSQFVEEFDVEVKVPLIGKRVAKFVTGETEEAIRKNLRFLERELAG